MQTCKLYRNLDEILHPSISRENITGYSIILNDKILPIKVFYPQIGIDLNKVVIYIPGVKQKKEFYDELAKRLESTILFLETENKEIILDTIYYIVEGLRDELVNNKISIIADDLSCNYLNDIDNDFISKKIYLYPRLLPKNDENTIIITDAKDREELNTYYIDGKFSNVMNTEKFAVRERIFSIIKSSCYKNK